MQIMAKSNTMTPRKAFRSVRFHVLAALFGIVMLYPLLWMFASSLKPNEEVFTTVTSLIPSKVVWENYKIGWESSGRYTFGTYFSNSLIIAVFSTIGGVISSSLVAFGFARIPFKGSKVFFAVMMATMLLPQQVLLIPQYIMFKKFGWINTFLPIIVHSSAACRFSSF